MAMDPTLIREFIEELPRDDRENLRRIIELLEAYADGLELEDIRQIALITSNSPVKAYQIYEEYSREQHLAKSLLVCDNITCLGKGAGILKKKLIGDRALLLERDIELEFVKCLGNCSRGPCLVYAGKIHGQIDLENLDTFLENLLFTG